MRYSKSPPKAAAVPFFSTGEEKANSLIHFFGALGAIAGLILLWLKTGGFLSAQRVTIRDIISAFVFSSTMLGMFAISTFYHAIKRQNAKNILRRLDHSMIFIFIAGTYTPLCLSAIQGAWGWGLFAFEWALAITGITLNVLNSKALKKIEIAAYVCMGWAIIAGFFPLVRSVPPQSVFLLIAGGIAYTLGIIWYRKKEQKYTHAIWHVFVIFGAVCHWFSIWYIY